MRYTCLFWDDLKIEFSAAIFAAEGSTVTEVHSIFQITDTSLDAEVQFLHMQKAIQRIAPGNNYEGADLIWKRYFVSDAANQAAYIDDDDSNSITSIVQQPPLNGAKVALWLYFSGGENAIYKDGNTLVVQRHESNKHLYTTQLQTPLKNEYAETEYIFKTYIETLQRHQSTLKENCIRTWIFVHGVDIHYKDMVKARVECFENEGLNRDTHYIASTGIEGRHVHPHTLVLMDAYAIEGIKKGQVRHLYAPTHLNRTHDYGVTFERGTSVDFADRRHVYISGTASINNKGEIVHPLDVMKQLHQVFENIMALLSEADCSMSDAVQMIIHLRDMADYTQVQSYFEKNYIEIPKVIVLAPVCRPGWLVEIECMAIKRIHNMNFTEF